MATGIFVTSEELRAAVGNMSLAVYKGYQDAIAIKQWLEATYPMPDPLGVDPLIAAFSIASEDAKTLRDAINDASYQAQAAYGSSKPLQQVRGLGI